MLEHNAQYDVHQMDNKINNLKSEKSINFKKQDSWKNQLNYSYIMSDFEGNTKSIKKYVLSNLVSNCANEIVTLLFDSNMDAELKKSVELESAIDEFLDKKLFNVNIN